MINENTYKIEYSNAMLLDQLNRLERRLEKLEADRYRWRRAAKRLGEMRRGLQHRLSRRSPDVCECQQMDDVFRELERERASRSFLFREVVALRKERDQLAGGAS